MDLHPDEWDFVNHYHKVPDWQLNDWLNYEYARSCRPIIDAVQAIRQRRSTPAEREAESFPEFNGAPRFAVYLTEQYPEFPATPWLNLPIKQKQKRSANGVGGQTLSEPFTRGAFEPWDTFHFFYQACRGEILLDSNLLEDHQYAVFKIDFERQDRLIVKMFRSWLKIRKKEFEKAKLERLRVLSTKPAVPRVVRSGQVNNKRSYEAAFKQLAALRLMNFYTDDYKTCFDVTWDSGPKPLYSAPTKSSWMRAKEDGEKKLLRFLTFWKIQREPAFIFNSKGLAVSLLWYPKTQKDLTAINKSEYTRIDIQNVFSGYNP